MSVEISDIFEKNVLYNTKFVALRLAVMSDLKSIYIGVEFQTIIFCYWIMLFINELISEFISEL